MAVNLITHAIINEMKKFRDRFRDENQNIANINKNPSEGENRLKLKINGLEQKHLKK